MNISKWKTRESNRWARYALVASLLIYLAGASLWQLDEVPAVWWDEGWTLSVARNWVERGHYGLYLEGHPRSVGLSASFPVVAPVALSFRLFGVGLLQGRLPGILYFWGALILFFYLSREIFNQKIAWAAILVLLFTPNKDQIHAILIGRQVLGELPSIFWLLAGYVFLMIAIRKSRWWMFLVVTAWAVALLTKAQVAPFWFVSVLLPLGFALFRKSWNTALILAVGLAGSWLATWVLSWILSGLNPGFIKNEEISNLLQVTAFVPIISVRFKALAAVFFFGMLTTLGLAFEIVHLPNLLRHAATSDYKILLRLAFWGLAASWFGWYLLFGNYWLRYLFPGVFFGSLFAAELLSKLTGGFDFRKTITSLAAIMRFQKFDGMGASAFMAVSLLALLIPMNFMTLREAFKSELRSTAMNTALYLDQSVSPGEVVETYDSELFFLSPGIQYHYPPDDIHVVLNERTFVGLATPIHYDWLGADPDYLVVGPFSDLWELYVNDPGFYLFQLAYENPGYQVYQRMR